MQLASVVEAARKGEFDSMEYRWDDVKDRLEEMWRMAFRAVDDIKVRFKLFVP